MDHDQFIEQPDRRPALAAILRWAFVGGCLWGVLFVLLIVAWRMRG